MAENLQYKTEVFFKEIILDGPLSKTKYYPIPIKFLERGIPHVHLFIRIFNSPNNENEAAYIRFTETAINTQLPNHLNNQELFELLRLTKIMPILELAGNTMIMNDASFMVDILLRRQLC